jgi:hypothetical protein
MERKGRLSRTAGVPARSYDRRASQGPDHERP